MLCDTNPVAYAAMIRKAQNNAASLAHDMEKIIVERLGLKPVPLLSMTRLAGFAIDITDESMIFERAGLMWLTLERLLKQFAGRVPATATTVGFSHSRGEGISQDCHTFKVYVGEKV